MSQESAESLFPLARSLVKRKTLGREHIAHRTSMAIPDRRDERVKTQGDTLSAIGETLVRPLAAVLVTIPVFPDLPPNDIESIP
jgi:hypothetical protein